MSLLLGRDFAQTFGARFAGRLDPASFTKFTTTTPDDANPSGPWNEDDQAYVCEAVALGYAEEDVDGSIVKRGDYRVVIMRASIGIANDDAATSMLDLSTVTTNADSVLASLTPGLLGDTFFVALVGDALAQAGSLEENDSEVTIHFLPGMTTVADLEALVATSAIIEVATPGTGANVLDTVDAFALTRLSGGSDATITPASVVPSPQDEITVPPPGVDGAATGRIVNVLAITDAAVTVQVRGTGE